MRVPNHPNHTSALRTASRRHVHRPPTWPLQPDAWPAHKRIWPRTCAVRRYDAHVPNTTYNLCTATRALSGVSTHWLRRHSLSAVRSAPGVAQSLQQSRRRCGSVRVQMWASPGADVGESRRRCGSVRVQMWAQSRRRCGPSPGADVGPVPAQMWAEPDCLRTYCRRLLARTRAVETTALTTQTHRRCCAHRRRRRRRADPRRS
jgi:hypothetical protein